MNARNKSGKSAADFAKAAFPRTPVHETCLQLLQLCERQGTARAMGLSEDQSLCLRHRVPRALNRPVRELAVNVRRLDQYLAGLAGRWEFAAETPADIVVKGSVGAVPVICYLSKAGHRHLLEGHRPSLSAAENAAALPSPAPFGAIFRTRINLSKISQGLAFNTNAFYLDASSGVIRVPAEEANGRHDLASFVTECVLPLFTAVSPLCPGAIASSSVAATPWAFRPISNSSGASMPPAAWPASSQLASDVVREETTVLRAMAAACAAFCGGRALAYKPSLNAIVGVVPLKSACPSSLLLDNASPCKDLAAQVIASAFPSFTDAIPVRIQLPDLRGGLPSVLTQAPRVLILGLGASREDLEASSAFLERWAERAALRPLAVFADLFAELQRGLSLSLSPFTKSPKPSYSLPTAPSGGVALACVRCRSNVKAVRLFPCEHLAFCVGCAESEMQGGAGAGCPLCRSSVTTVAEVRI